MSKPKPGTNKPQSSKAEYSAGGIVQDGQNLLMVKVRNLEGVTVWTFPKGHLEPGETAEQAAVREVLEETGYECKITAPFDRVQYYFQRNGETIKKTVTWYLMAMGDKSGVHDPEEIMETEWVPYDEALKRAQYKSDQQLLEKLKNK